MGYLVIKRAKNGWIVENSLTITEQEFIVASSPVELLTEISEAFKFRGVSISQRTGGMAPVEYKGNASPERKV